MLVAASKEGNCSQVSQLVADGADVNCRDDKSNTPLMWASAMGHLQTLDTLLNCKARLEERDKDGYTALHWAVAQKKLDSVKKLIAHKADVNALNKEGDTPLHRAAHYDNKEIANALINNGAKLNIQNKTHQTPFDKSRTKSFKIWFYGQGGRPHSSKFDVEGLANANKNDNNDNDNNGNDNGIAKPADVLANDEKEDDNYSKNNNNNNKMDPEERALVKKEEMKMKVKQWLQGLTLAEYYDKFIGEGYDRFESCIFDVTKDELKDIGVKSGHIKIIMNSINEMKSNKLIYNEEPGALQHGNVNNNNNSNDDNNGNDYFDAQEREGSGATRGGLVMGQLES